MGKESGHRLLTFRLDADRRQRLRARLTREGQTMSEVVTHGLRLYVQRHSRPEPNEPNALELPDRIAVRLRELRSTGRSELLSATLAALHEAGWPLRPLAEALGISKQAVQARVRDLRASAAKSGKLPGPLGEYLPDCEPPPPFPHRRLASPDGLRPHLTVRIDHALRTSAHQIAAGQGHSLTQVVEGILDRYLHHGLADGDQEPGSGSRSTRSTPSSRSR